MSPASLLTADGASGDSLSVGGSTFANLNVGGSVAAVPEPSSVVLLILGSLAILLSVAQRRASRSQALPGNALPVRLRLNIGARSPRFQSDR